MQVGHNPRVALVHDWLVGMRGGEAVLEELCQLFPAAEIFTLFHERGSVSDTIERHPIHASALNRSPLRKHYRWLLPFFPWAIEKMDVREFDLVIASGHCVAHGIGGKRQDQLRICYCHTPMRYAWSATEDYARSGFLSGLALKAVAGRLREWDRRAAQNVDLFIANSQNVAGRVRRFYERPAEVLYPPVDVDFFTPSPLPRQNFFLVVSANAPYKRIDQAVAAATKTGRRLVIAGPGQIATCTPYDHHASPIEFRGPVSRERLLDLYRTARAFLMPGEEDFGIAAVEAMSTGCPVIAFAAGGALETVRDAGQNMANPTGLLYKRPEMACLAQAMMELDGLTGRFDPVTMHEWARRFSPAQFSEGFKQIIGPLLRQRDWTSPW